MKIFGRSAFFLMVGVIAVGLLTFTPRLAEATSITFEYIFEFSEGDEPVSSTLPWLTATFDDDGSPGSVTLALEATNLTASEFVTGWYFNLDPDLELSSLVIDQPDVPEVGGTVENSGISTGTDAFQADGDGLYDILIEFPTTNEQEHEYRFEEDDTAIFEITLAGLTAGDFNFLSTPAGGHGPFHTAAHVQGIGEDALGSGWVAPVPEPASMLLVGAGLIGLAAFGRKKFFKKS